MFEKTKPSGTGTEKIPFILLSPAAIEAALRAFPVIRPEEAEELMDFMAGSGFSEQPFDKLRAPSEVEGRSRISQGIVGENPEAQT